MSANIYIIEDDRSIRDELKQLLELHNFAPYAFEGDDFSVAADQAVQLDADCVILDINLPNENGLSICKAIKAQRDIPIIVVTSSKREYDEVTSINLGADSYIKKPYSPAVLLAHIQSILKRQKKWQEPRKLEYAGLELDMSKGIASFQGKQTELTRNESQILEALMREPGIIITRTRLMSDLWESDEFIDDNTLTVNVSRLREKLALIGVVEDFLATKRGLGYYIKTT